jgi:hypothetical protein
MYALAMPVRLKIRRMKTNETLVAEFADLDDAETWLRERPQFVDVIGTIGELGDADDQRLRTALRPFDDEERAVIAAQDQAFAKAEAAALARAQLEAEAALAERRAELANADPNRPMMVAWVRGVGCRNADRADARDVTELARAAVLAWVRERDTWVHPRGQFIATADVVVWPGPIPGGDEDDRIQPGGQFSAVSSGGEDPPPIE